MRVGRGLRSKGEKLTVDLLEGEPVDDDPEVVEEGQRDYHRPIVAESSRRIEDEGPVGRAGLEAPRARLARVAPAAPLLLLLRGRVAPVSKVEALFVFAFYYDNRADSTAQKSLVNYLTAHQCCLLVFTPHQYFNVH